MSTRYSLCTFNEFDNFVDFIDNEDDFIVYHLITILVYLSFIASFIAIFLMATVGIIPIEDYVNSKRNDLFSLDTFVEIFCILRNILPQRYNLQNPVNIYNFTLNLLIFILDLYNFTSIFHTFDNGGFNGSNRILLGL